MNFVTFSHFCVCFLITFMSVQLLPLKADRCDCGYHTSPKLAIQRDRQPWFSLWNQAGNPADMGSTSVPPAPCKAAWSSCCRAGTARAGVSCGQVP